MAINPIYKFELTIGETTERCYPVYRDDLAKEFELQSNEQFFRAKLSGKLTFEGPDYARIVAAAFETQFLLLISISYDAGRTWVAYWRGVFWKTDCTINFDDQTVTVNPTVKDQYNDVLAGIDKEFNLIDLAPAVRPVKVDKRPMIQAYIPGQSTIACFLSGMWWEQECEAVNESDTEWSEEEQRNVKVLEARYHFALNNTLFAAEFTDAIPEGLPKVFTHKYTGNNRFPVSTIGTYDIVSGDYTLRYHFDAGQGGQTRQWRIIRNSDNAALWENIISGQIAEQIPLPYMVEMSPVAGSGATGTYTMFIHEIPVYCRCVLDTETLMGQPTSQMPEDDLVGNNRNYRRVIAYQFTNSIYFSTRLSETPTKWGLYQPGQYFAEPALFPALELYPVSRNAWTYISIWFAPSAIDPIMEADGRQPFVLNDAYPLWSVISVLLGQIAPGITHADTVNYSQFLYGTNPITNTLQTLLIVPKSNLITANYDQPAQKAPITLKKVMDMLRDCFRCYWYIDDENRFRIEHISYFMHGGQYGSSQPAIGIDLTSIALTRNNKNWAFAQREIEYDKPNMPARYQFGWMDEVTELFEGYPIDIVSKCVNESNIERISISQFTSDVDYILLNPGEISKDGFVLMSAISSYAPTQIIDADGTWQSLRLKAGYRIVTITGTAQIYLSTSLIPGEGTAIGPITPSDLPYTVPFDTKAILGYNPDGGAMTIQFTTDALELPYVSYHIGNADQNLQNGYVAFHYLQDYYTYDMPAFVYKINNTEHLAESIKKLKLQKVSFPALNDPDLMRFVKTNVGNGIIQKISINLSSRNAKATLKYDTI